MLITYNIFFSTGLKGEVWGLGEVLDSLTECFEEVRLYTTTDSTDNGAVELAKKKNVKIVRLDYTNEIAIHLDSNGHYEIRNIKFDEYLFYDFDYIYTDYSRMANYTFREILISMNKEVSLTVIGKVQHEGILNLKSRNKLSK